MKERTKAHRKKKASKETSYTEGRHSPPVITVDYEKYAHFLEDSDLTDEQKREFLQTLWNIIVEFVSLGWGVHPLQQAQKPCGQLKEFPAKSTPTAPNAVYSGSQFLAEHFKAFADLETDAGVEGVER